jgi:hypothetical protein
MDTRQQIRNKAAAFLDEIREGVAKIIQEPGKRFDFSSYVSEWDDQHKCGTICCMVGWIPAIRPDLAKWDFIEGETKLYVATHSGEVFLPLTVGVPIRTSLWVTITLPGYQCIIKEDSLILSSTFPEVASLWQRTAERIRAGELDEFLIFENKQ